MEEQYAICRVSIAPMRGETNDQSEIVSQLLFGDGVTILEKQRSGGVSKIAMTVMKAG